MTDRASSDFGPYRIYSSDGDHYVLAATYKAALDDIDPITEELEDLGWMQVVPYPEDYQSREEWEAAPDFTEPWWESCAPPIDGNATERCLRAWEIHYR